MLSLLRADYLLCFHRLQVLGLLSSPDQAFAEHKLKLCLLHLIYRSIILACLLLTPSRKDIILIKSIVTRLLLTLTFQTLSLFLDPPLPLITIVRKPKKWFPLAVRDTAAPPINTILPLVTNRAEQLPYWFVFVFSFSPFRGFLPRAIDFWQYTF